MSIRLVASNLQKEFVMHLRDGTVLPVIANGSFDLEAGKCAVLSGPSGVGKSSILKMIYGNYAIDSGQIIIRTDKGLIDIATATPREVLWLRKNFIGYVSQFLSVLPRVSTLNVIAEPLVAQGADRVTATARAERLLEKLKLPSSLWELPPATFSGGEQQRVNIARGFITSHPVLLLDEPTASLDAANREIVLDLINEKKQEGVAMLGIFHDHQTRERVADKLIDVSEFSPHRSAA